MEWLSVRNPMTTAEVEAVERELGIKLPEDYKEQIGSINGGALKKACVVCEAGRIPYSRNVSLSQKAKGNIFELFGSVMDSKQFFPFANVGNGDLFCFDLKNKNVVLWKHEANELIGISNSFSELLEMIE